MAIIKKVENNQYGVNLQDKEAVKKELERLKKKHRMVTLFAFLIIFLLFIPILDFIQVRMGGVPKIAISSKIENGILYKGIGYQVTICEDGTQNFGTSAITCNKKEVNTFHDLVYAAFLKYAKQKKIIDPLTLEELTLENVLFDESHEDGSNDYVVDIHYVCKENTDCFTPLKEVEDKNSITLYITLDRMNDVVNLFPFKTSGLYYESLKEKYTKEVLQCLIEHNLAIEENVRLFQVDLVKNYGIYTYNGVSYSDSYLIRIYYMCVDNGNQCVVSEKSKEEDNLAFDMSMFIGKDGSIALLDSSFIFRE